MEKSTDYAIIVLRNSIREKMNEIVAKNKVDDVDSPQLRHLFQLMIALDKIQNF